MVELNIFGFLLAISYRIIALLGGIVASAIVLLIYSSKKPKEEVLTNKLHGIGETQKFLIDNNTYKTSYGKFYGKYLKQSMGKDGGVIEQFVQTLKINPIDIERKLKLINSDFTVEEFISLRVLSLIIGALMALLGFIAYSSMLFFVGFIILFLGIAGFEKIIIGDKVKARQKEFERSLPNFLDLLYSACKAGHTITEAIKKVSTKYIGVVADEFNKCMIESRGNGGNFTLAMEQMSERNDIESLSDIISDILIAFDKGDEKIIETLKDEADRMRDLVNAEIEEIANRKSSTLIFPMLIFSFGPLFAFILIPLFSQFTTLMK